MKCRPLYSHTTLISSGLELRDQIKHEDNINTIPRINKTMIMTNARAPRTPPIIAPVFELGLIPAMHLSRA